MNQPHKYKPLDAQTQALQDQFKQAGFKPANQLPLEASRAGLTQMVAAMAGSKVEVFDISDRTLPGPGGALPIRIYRPGSPAKGVMQPAVMYFHGGGFYLGDLETHDPICRFLCKNANLIVIAVDYRLAPENKFPAAVEDCYFALRWVADHAANIGVDPDRIALAGDSAGATLVVTTCLLARERGGPRIAYQVAVGGALSMTEGPEFASRKELGSGEYFIAQEDFAMFRKYYLTNPDREMLDPLVSPIYAKDYRGFPPALVIAAEYDPLRDENALYAERLKQDGVSATYKCFEGTTHPFFVLDGVIDAGKEGQKLVAATLRNYLGT